MTVGLYPITPLQEAGILNDPPVSVPKEHGTTFNPTVPALPPLDPPAILVGSRADLDVPQVFYRRDVPDPNSSMLVFPAQIAPSSTKCFQILLLTLAKTFTF